MVEQLRLRAISVIVWATFSVALFNGRGLFRSLNRQMKTMCNSGLFFQHSAINRREFFCLNFEFNYKSLEFSRKFLEFSEKILVFD